VLGTGGGIVTWTAGLWLPFIVAFVTTVVVGWIACALLVKRDAIATAADLTEDESRAAEQDMTAAQGVAAERIEAATTAHAAQSRGAKTDDRRLIEESIDDWGYAAYDTDIISLEGARAEDASARDVAGDDAWADSA
jgi:hypothetical protein